MSDDNADIQTPEEDLQLAEQGNDDVEMAGDWGQQGAPAPANMTEADWAALELPEHWFWHVADNERRFRIPDIRAYVDCVDSFEEGGSVLECYLDSICAIAVDLKIADDGSKLLRLVYDKGILLVYLPKGFESMPKDNAIRRLLEGYNVYKVGVDIIATFDALHQWFDFQPITALELGAFAQRARPQEFPTEEEARADNLVAILNGRILVEGVPDQWISNPSIKTSRVAAFQMFEISEVFHALSRNEFRNAPWGSPPLRPIRSLE